MKSLKDLIFFEVPPGKFKKTKNKAMKIFEALYNPMTWESAYCTLSLHLSKEGAEKAIAFHKMGKIKEWEGRYPNKDNEPYKFGEFEDWRIIESEVLP